MCQHAFNQNILRMFFCVYIYTKADVRCAINDSLPYLQAVRPRRFCILHVLLYRLIKHDIFVQKL